MAQPQQFEPLPSQCAQMQPESSALSKLPDVSSPQLKTSLHANRKAHAAYEERPRKRTLGS